jgi:hypothetical protein
MRLGYWFTPLLSWSRVSRQIRQTVLALMTLLLTLGVACAVTDGPKQSSTQDILEPLKHKLVASAEAYYFYWTAFTIPIKEEALLSDSWTCKTVVKLPFPSGDRLRETLAKVELQPQQQSPDDFRLACVFHLHEEGQDEEKFTLSFAQVPPSMCINGKPFKPSRELLLLISEFLPNAPRRELLAGTKDKKFGG